MPHNYYYLVAGLPDIVLEGNKNVPTLPEFLHEAAGQVAPEDAALLSVLRRPADNENLLVLLEGRDEPFDPLGTYSREELESEIRTLDTLPTYMQTFVEAYRQGHRPLGPRTSADLLGRSFFEWAVGYPQWFIRDWFTFELDLRNVLVALNCRKMAGVEGSAYSLEASLIPGNEVAERILKSNAPDFSLGSELPWIEEILSFDDTDPVRFESSVDTLRWDVLNDMTLFTYFQIETILAFCLKLGMVDRWRSLDAGEGKKKLDRLITELVSGVQLSQDFS